MSEIEKNKRISDYEQMKEHQRMDKYDLYNTICREGDIVVKDMNGHNKIIYIYEEMLKNNDFKGKIYCSCLYYKRDLVKSLGFKWNPKLKLWYMPIHLFTYEIFLKSHITRWNKFELFLKSHNSIYITKNYYYVDYKDRYYVETLIKNSDEDYKKHQIKQKIIKKENNKKENNKKSEVKKYYKIDYENIDFLDN